MSPRIRIVRESVTAPLRVVRERVARLGEGHWNTLPPERAERYAHILVAIANGTPIPAPVGGWSADDVLMLAGASKLVAKYHLRYGGDQALPLSNGPRQRTRLVDRAINEREEESGTFAWEFGDELVEALARAISPRPGKQVTRSRNALTPVQTPRHDAKPRS